MKHGRRTGSRKAYRKILTGSQLQFAADLPNMRRKARSDDESIFKMLNIYKQIGLGKTSSGIKMLNLCRAKSYQCFEDKSNTLLWH